MNHQDGSPDIDMDQLPGPDESRGEKAEMPGAYPGDRVDVVEGPVGSAALKDPETVERAAADDRARSTIGKERVVDDQ
jgi:hypothetical protein